jgi:hypothetical protein
MAKADPAVTVAGVAVNAAVVETPQFATKFAATAPGGTDGKYCVKVTKATTPPTTATAISPSMIFRVSLNLDFDFGFSSNSHPPLPQTRLVSFTSTDILNKDHES